MFTGLLPIGTVVLLTESTKKVMIIGFLQKEIAGTGKVWDYAGCVYPEGYMQPDKTYLFNSDQIERIYSVGYQDEEQFNFKVRVDGIWEGLRSAENPQNGEQPQE